MDSSAPASPGEIQPRETAPALAAPSAHERYRATSRFAALDGLRAFAAAAVFWHHATVSTSGFFARSVGVTVFFVISGFLITRMLIREKERTETISIGRFLVRRALRTFPLYYAILGLYVLLVALLERGTPAGAAFWSRLPYYLTFTANWFVNREPGERMIFYFAWSLAAQEQFYVLWPVILRFARRRFAVAIPLAFLLLQDGLELAAAPGSPALGLVRRIIISLDSPIYLGVLAAIALENRRAFELLHRIAGRPWSLPLALTLLLGPALFAAEPQGAISLSVTYLVMASVLWRGARLPVLENQLVRHVGKVSYGVYLMHMLGVNAVRRTLPGVGPSAVFGISFLVTVLAASASNRWFEQPVLRLRDARFTARAP